MLCLFERQSYQGGERASISDSLPRGPVELGVDHTEAGSLEFHVCPTALGFPRWEVSSQDTACTHVGGGIPDGDFTHYTPTGPQDFTFPALINLAVLALSQFPSGVLCPAELHEPRLSSRHLPGPGTRRGCLVVHGMAVPIPGLGSSAGQSKEGPAEVEVLLRARPCHTPSREPGCGADCVQSTVRVAVFSLPSPEALV